MVDVEGSCLCGSVKYSFRGEIVVFQYCHCSRCKKYTGSAHASNMIGDPTGFQWVEGEEYVSRYEMPEARHFATSFCKRCGSSLPWITKSKKAVVIPAGTLDSDPEIKPTQSIYYKNRAPWYVNVHELIKYDALPEK